MKIFAKQQENWWDQDHLIKILLAASFIIHLLFLVFGNSLHLPKQDNIGEIAIETDLISEADLKPASKTIIPEAKEADKPSVPSNLLPQLNKDFAIKSASKQPEGLEPDKEAVTQESANEKPPSKDTENSIENDSSTQLAKQEALKRLAMEKLRKEQKEKSTELKAHENDKLAQVKEALDKDKGISKDLGEGALSKAAGRMYANYLTRAIRKNWALPKTFQLLRSDMKASLDVSINARGALVSVKINEGSGDSTFDQYCIDAVKNSSPFKAPPQSRAGTAITINCIP